MEEQVSSGLVEQCNAVQRLLLLLQKLVMMADQLNELWPK